MISLSQTVFALIMAIIAYALITAFHLTGAAFVTVLVLWYFLVNFGDQLIAAKLVEMFSDKA